eukprot:TRINITY_DN5574_c0_g1_i1.p1 TRINITY_DN5574_c0_g1~~TRINITY_DN5574_c0_g1_i1.p1  ORF type:complete len:625 (+),score=148.68 TRINITY_DN5574_c0_g1_i1:88-1962(+)
MESMEVSTEAEDIGMSTDASPFNLKSFSGDELTFQKPTEEEQLEAYQARASDAPIKQEFLRAVSKVKITKEDKIKAENSTRRNVPKRERHTHTPKNTICFRFASGTSCPNEPCKFSHDAEAFLSQKPADIGQSCYIWDITGKCRYGLTCRFGSCHTKDNKTVVDDEKYQAFSANIKKFEALNIVPREILHSLSNHRYNYDKSNQFLTTWNQILSKRGSSSTPSLTTSVSTTTEQSTEENPDSTQPALKKQKIYESEGETVLDAIPRRKLDFKDKLYLAPLTTLGNLPYRKICKTFGADITCGEMALASKLMSGAIQEWALVKRDPSEDLFGVQLCDQSPEKKIKCAQVIQDQIQVDFVDINCGCPIDLICRKGAGSALMERKTKIEGMVKGMRSVLDVPVTIKIRTGKDEKNPFAHNLIPQLEKWGVSAVTVHGRSRQQRYYRSADWNYIATCKDSKLDETVQLIGNGDIYHWKQAEDLKEVSKVDCVMIARGALIKPWIFTEIKEKRDWDISANERFDILKNFVHAGLYHWGSDDKGVNNTREFLLQWLSFLYRYVPVGLVEQEKVLSLKDRAPSYFGRNDLETIMGSPHVEDWIKISELLLGPVGPNFRFVPKHKSNAYAQG